MYLPEGALKNIFFAFISGKNNFLFF